MPTLPLLCLAAPCLLSATVLNAEDWPMRGRDNSRNAVSPEKNPPLDWQVPPSRPRPGSPEIAIRNFRWSAALGSISMAEPVIADGLVWIGTNNDHPRDPDRKEDAAVLMCFREADGQFLYQHLSPRHPEGKRFDWEHGSLASSPLVEGDRLWFCTNRAEVVCLDIAPLKAGTGHPRVLWKLDMMEDLKILPSTAMLGGNTLHCSVASYDRFIYVNTTNGNHAHGGRFGSINAEAPSLICLDKETGKVVWQDRSPAANLIDVQQSNPLAMDVNGQAQVVMGQGDGWLRAFDARTGESLWQFDINLKGAKERDYFTATPVFYEGKVYAASGRHAEHGGGPGRLVCIDPTRRGDVSSQTDDGQRNPNSAVVWEYLGSGEDRMGLAMASVTIHDDTLLGVDAMGKAHCLSAQTGARYWTHDLKARVWSSPLMAGGKAYIGTEEGEIFILSFSPEKGVHATMEFDGMIYVTPVFANGTLYVTTTNHLYAIRGEQ